MKKQNELIESAQQMLSKAYVPYSHFPVGAALVTKDGKIFSGCNIENSSYGLTNCAERTAIFKAVSEGHLEFEGMVITAKTEEPVSPCGACRQVLSEFCDADMPVLLTNEEGDTFKTTVGELLPGYFTAEDIKNAKL